LSSIQEIKLMLAFSKDLSMHLTLAQKN